MCVVVLLYCLCVLCVLFEGFKVIGVYGVVACKDNDKVGECSIVVG